jgi:hypothetical protein
MQVVYKMKDAIEIYTIKPKDYHMRAKAESHHTFLDEKPH